MAAIAQRTRSRIRSGDAEGHEEPEEAAPEVAGRCRVASPRMRQARVTDAFQARKRRRPGPAPDKKPIVSPPSTARHPRPGDGAGHSPAPKHKPVAVKKEEPRKERRAAPEKAGGTSPYPLSLLRSHLLHHLRPGSAPEAMAGREHEHATLSTFLRDRIAQRYAGSLYLCGSPGTGKTASVHFVLRSLIHCGALDPAGVDVAFLHAAALADSGSLFRHLWCVLEQGTDGDAGLPSADASQAEFAAALRAAPSADACCDQLERRLAPTRASQRGSHTPDRRHRRAGGGSGSGEETARPAVVVLDEMDQLVGRGSGSDSLYRLFEWAAEPRSPLIFIGIANAIDLTDRFLPHLHRRKCQPQVLLFEPYSPARLQGILRDRVAAAEAALRGEEQRGASEAAPAPATPPPDADGSDSDGPPQSKRRAGPPSATAARKKAVAASRRAQRQRQQQQRQAEASTGRCMRAGTARTLAWLMIDGASPSPDHSQPHLPFAAPGSPGSPGDRPSSLRSPPLPLGRAPRHSSTAAAGSPPSSPGGHVPPPLPSPQESGRVSASSQLRPPSPAKLPAAPSALVDDVALELLARKVSGLSGDVRRALELCSAACRLALPVEGDESGLKGSEGGTEGGPGWDGATPCVRLQHARAACAQLLGSRAAESVASLPKHAQALLCVLVELAEAAASEVTVGHLHEAHTRLARAQELPTLSAADVADLLHRLEQADLVAVSSPAVASTTVPSVPATAGVRRGGTQVPAATAAAASATLQRLARSRGRRRTGFGARGGRPTGASLGGGPGAGAPHAAASRQRRVQLRVTREAVASALRGSAQVDTWLLPAQRMLAARLARAQRLAAEVERQREEAAAATAAATAATQSKQQQEGQSRQGSTAVARRRRGGTSRRMHLSQLLETEEAAVAGQWEVARARREVANADHPLFGKHGYDKPLPYAPRQLPSALAGGCAGARGSNQGEENEEEEEAQPGEEEEEEGEEEEGRATTVPHTVPVSGEGGGTAEAPEELKGLFAAW